MKDFLLIDNSFSSENTMHYQISIQFTLNGYSFCIFDTNSNKYIALKQVTFLNKYHIDVFLDDFRKMLNSEELFYKDYKSVRFCFINSKANLIPAGVFDKADLLNYVQFNGNFAEGHEIHYNLQLPDIYIIFSLPSYITTLLVNKFSNISFYHQALPFIDENLNYFYGSNLGFKNIFAIDCYSNFFDVLLSENGKLIFYNSFDYNTASDFIYLVINIFEQFKLANNSTIVSLSGAIGEKTKIVSFIRKYLQNVVFAQFDKQKFYSSKFKNIKEHFFVNLINSHRCVL